MDPNIPQQQEQQVPPAPVSQPIMQQPFIEQTQQQNSSSNHSKLLFIIIGVLILIIAGMGVYIFNSKKNQSNESIQQASKSAIPTSSAVVPTTTAPSVTVNPTANWKTYTTQGFTIKYPVGWSTEDITQNLKYSTKDLETDIRFIYDNPKNGPRTFDLIVENSPIDRIDQDFKDSIGTLMEGDFGAKNTVKTTVTKSKSEINGIQVIKIYVTSITDYQPPSTSIHYVVLLPMKNKTVEFSINKVDQTLLNQILSTFKFTQ